MRARLLLAAVAVAGPAAAALPTVRIDSVTSAKQCTLYQLGAGAHREAGVVTARGAAFAAETTWRSWLVRDCVDNFASLRTSLQAALAASGTLAVVPGGGAYVVSGRLSDVGGATGQVETAGAGMATADMVVSMDVTVRDAAGRIVYGGLRTKHLETGSAMATQGLATAAGRSGQELYTELQHVVALAVARTVAFRIVPLRVTGVSGGRIQLNYGAPLLQLGTLVQVTPPGGAMARFTVSGAGQGSAQADYQGGGPAAAVTPGSPAIVIEADDPAANARRFERVDLP